MNRSMARSSGRLGLAGKSPMTRSTGRIGLTGQRSMTRSTGRIGLPGKGSREWVMSNLTLMYPAFAKPEPTTLVVKEKNSPGDSGKVYNADGNLVLEVDAGRRLIRNARGAEVGQIRRKKALGHLSTYYLGTMSDEKRCSVKAKRMLNPTEFEAEIYQRERGKSLAGGVSGNWKDKSFKVIIDGIRAAEVKQNPIKAGNVPSESSYSLEIAANVDCLFIVMIITVLEDLYDKPTVVQRMKSSISSGAEVEEYLPSDDEGINADEDGDGDSSISSAGKEAPSDDEDAPASGVGTSNATKSETAGATPNMATKTDNAVTTNYNSSRVSYMNHASSSRSYYIRNRVRGEQAQALQSLRDMKNRVDRSSSSVINDMHAEEIREAEEILELVSNLNQTNRQNEETIQSLQQLLLDTEAELKKSKEEEVSHWRNEQSRMQKMNYKRIEKMALKVQEQIQSHSETAKDEVDGWKDKHEQMDQLYDELVQTVGSMADENALLLTRCEQLEQEDSERKEDLAAMQDICAENDILRQSMDEAVQLLSATEDKVADSVKVHAASVKGYEEQLAKLNESFNQKPEIKDMVSRFQLATLTKGKDEAHLACDVLQKEIDSLRLMVGELKEGEYYESTLDPLVDDNGAVQKNKLTETPEVNDDCLNVNDRQNVEKDKSADVMDARQNWERLTKFTKAYKHLTEYCLSEQESLSESPDCNERSQFGRRDRSVSYKMPKSTGAEREIASKLQSFRF